MILNMVEILSLGENKIQPDSLQKTVPKQI